MSFVRSRRAGKIRVFGFQGRAAAWLLLFLLLPMSGAMAAASAAADAARSYLERWQAESGAPGVSAAVSVAGELVFSGGVGVSDLESGMPQNGRSVHNIGSISKTQAVVAILQLVELGKVRLDAEVQEYVPWFPKKQRPVTVRQVLTHTSGIRHYRDDEFEPGELWMFRHYDRVEESTAAGATIHWRSIRARAGCTRPSRPTCCTPSSRRRAESRSRTISRGTSGGPPGWRIRASTSLRASCRAVVGATSATGRPGCWRMPSPRT